MINDLLKRNVWPRRGNPICIKTLWKGLYLNRLYPTLTTKKWRHWLPPDLLPLENGTSTWHFNNNTHLNTRCVYRDHIIHLSCCCFYSNQLVAGDAMSNFNLFESAPIIIDNLDEKLSGKITVKFTSWVPVRMLKEYRNAIFYLALVPHSMHWFLPVSRATRKFQQLSSGTFLTLASPAICPVTAALLCKCVFRQMGRTFYLVAATATGKFTINQKTAPTWNVSSVVSVNVWQQNVMVLRMVTWLEIFFFIPRPTFGCVAAG